MGELTFPPNVKILPWVGKNYDKTSPKILILGESIPDERISRQVVRNRVKSLINGKWNYAFFTKLQNMFSSEDQWNRVGVNNYELDHDAFWNSISFTEYVQAPLKSVRNRPTLEMWETAKDVFVEILKTLKPDIVIVIGFDTYNHLPEFGTDGKTIKWHEHQTETWVYKIGRKSIHLIKVQHPSSPGFKQEVWTHLFGVFLRKISGQLSAPKQPRTTSK